MNSLNPQKNTGDGENVNRSLNLNETPTFNANNIEKELEDDLSDSGIILNNKESEKKEVETNLENIKKVDQKNTDSEKNITTENKETEPIVEKNIDKKINTADPDLKNLRTFEDDVKNAIQKDNISTTKIVLAEQVKKQKADDISKTKKDASSAPNTKKSKKISKKTIITFISFVFFTLGALLIYFNFEYLKPYIENLNQPHQSGKVSIIDANESVIIDSQGKTRGQIIDNIQNIISNRNIGADNNVVEIIITKEVTRTIDGVQSRSTERITSSDFFNLINAEIPDSLRRSFNDSFVLGIHNLVNAEPFIILQSENLGLTFTGMLSWERGLGTDIRSIFFQNLTPQSVSQAVPTVSNQQEDQEQMNDDETEGGNSNEEGDDDESNLESQPDTSIATFNIREFVDLVISNNDARAIVDSEGNILFFYSIVDNENVVMTTNRQTLSVVLDRINRARLLRQ